MQIDPSKLGAEILERTRNYREAYAAEGIDRPPSASTVAGQVFGEIRSLAREGIEAYAYVEDRNAGEPLCGFPPEGRRSLTQAAANGDATRAPRPARATEPGETSTE